MKLSISILTQKLKTFLIAFSVLVLVACSSMNNQANRVLKVSEIAESQRYNKHQREVVDGLQRMSSGYLADASKHFNSALQLNPVNGNYHLLNAMTYHMDALNGNAAVTKFMGGENFTGEGSWRFFFGIR